MSSVKLDDPNSKSSPSPASPDSPADHTPKVTSMGLMSDESKPRLSAFTPVSTAHQLPTLPGLAPSLVGLSEYLNSRMLPFAKFADLAAKSSAEGSSLLAGRSSVVGGSSSEGGATSTEGFPPVFRPMFPPGTLFPGADTALIYRGLGEFPLAPTGLPAFCKYLFKINLWISLFLPGLYICANPWMQKTDSEPTDRFRVYLLEEAFF